MVAERKRREGEKIKEKRRIQEDMRKIMEAKLHDFESQTNNRLNKDHEEARIAAEMTEVIRAEKATKEQIAIDISRKHQLRIRDELKAAEKGEEKRFVEQWKVRNVAIKAEEEAEQNERFQRSIKLQDYHKKQMRLKLEKKETERRQQLEEAMLTRAFIEEDDKMFQQYAQLCIDEWGKTGKSLKPMQLEIVKQNSMSMSSGRS